MAVPFGKYLLERKLAEGGMAEIYLARPGPGFVGTPRSQLVVKRLFSHHSGEAEFVRMFFNESRLAARLKHPNIVDIFDQGEVEGAYYLAMEYIHGEDLRSIAQQADTVNKRPPLGVVCRIVMDMLAGLHYAHTLADENGAPLGLVHRDISPQNVLVTYDGVVKVIDFGIAKATQARDGEQTQAGLIKGKYAYMSPEQTRSGQLDARSDVFSAGILLWELVTWRRLFKRGTDLATLVAVTEEPAPSLALINPDVPKELDEVALKSLAPESAARYASAQDFLEALDACCKQLGLDNSRDALARYMREIFATKLAQQQAEARAIARAAGGMTTRQPGSQAPRQRAMTMPLQVITPAVAQAARARGIPAAPERPPGDRPPGDRPSAERGPGEDAPSRSSLRTPAVPAPASSRSLPMPIQGAASSRSLPLLGTGQSLPPQPAPALSEATVPVPVAAVESGAHSGPVALEPAAAGHVAPADQRRRVVVAVVIGVLIGIIAVLALQLLLRGGS